MNTNEDGGLIEILQNCLQLLNQYNALCARAKELSRHKDNQYQKTCFEAYECYQRCHMLIFERIVHLDEFKFLQLGPSTSGDGGDAPSLLSVYNKIKNLLLSDDSIETIKFDCYNYAMNNTYMKQLVSTSWISMGFMYNILTQKGKLTLVIEIGEQLEDMGTREIIPCQNYVRIPKMLIQENDTVSQLESKMEDSLSVLISEALLFKERNNFDCIILFTTDSDQSKVKSSSNVSRMLVLFEKIAKGLNPNKATGTYPNIFIAIMDFEKWRFLTLAKKATVSNVPKFPIPSPNSMTILSNINSTILVGIHNQSNSCYINSIVQSLLGTHELINLFLSPQFKNIREDPKQKSIVTWSLVKLVRNAYDSSIHHKVPISVEELKTICGNLCDQFKGNNQEDCAEFCQFLLNRLNVEMKIDSNNDYTRSDTQATSGPDKEWVKYSAQNYSIITKLFVGQMSSELNCKICHSSSITYETFSMLSLPIPRVRSCNIMECFRQLFRKHDLESSNQWKCSRCRKLTPSTQKLTLVRKPKIFIIQLKRFDNYLTKNNCFVKYPIILDQGYTGLHDDFKYELYSVVCHHGAINNGHYTTYVQKGHPKEWNYFDDTVVRPVRIPTEFITSDAYLLFYRLIG